MRETAFGMATSAESRGEHAALYPELKAAGVTLMRAWPEWGRIQPGQGQWNWSECDALLRSARGNDIELVGGLWYLANWAATDGKFPLQDVNDWFDYVYAMASRYRGVVNYWECWNEFNGAFARGGKVADYVQLLEHAYRAAKQADPNCRVGISCASVDITFFEQVIAGGAGDCFDFLCIHPYESFSTLVQDGQVMAFLNMRKTVLEMLYAHHLPMKEVWITESGDPAKAGDAADEQLQAESLVKLYTLGFAQGIDKVFWFEGKGPDYPDGNFGLLRRDWSKRPSYHALKTMADLLGRHPVYTGWLSLTDGSYGFVFTGEAQPVLVIWAKSNESLSFPCDVAVTQLNGSSRPVSAGREITLTQTPQFVTGLSAALLAEAAGHLAQEFPWSTYSGSGPATIVFDAVPVERGLCQLDTFGRVLPGQVEGQWAVRTPARKGSEFRSVVFDVDDAYAGYGDHKVQITIAARRVDTTVNTGMNLIYESTAGYTNYGQWWTIPAGTGWHQKTYTLDNAQFVNKWGWNFSFQNETSGDFWIRDVRVTKLGVPAR
ncbi:MAG: endo-1,4-beta-xylanase [Sedimentisphaerales bacterium]|nr:endo-1,4-beta-xylanase [Sedimentisphaerales bacterium]